MEAKIATLKPCIILKKVLAVSSLVLLIIRLKSKFITFNPNSTNITKFLVEDQINSYSAS